MTSCDTIKVYVRVRPQDSSLNQNNGVCINVVDESSVVVKSPNEKQFTFDHIFNQTCTQASLFDKVGKQIVEGCIEGYNGTIFAYGQTGSGKTYTMLGPSNDFSEVSSHLCGVIPRCLNYLFDLIQQKAVMHGDQMTFQCKCSFLEIYRENIYDLFDKDVVHCLQLRESPKRGVFVDGITEEIATSAKDAFQLVLTGLNNRHVASTSMNRESSRSHAVFSISVESKDRTGNLTTTRNAVLNMVDLAGSERQKETGSEGERLMEAGSINKSLSVIGNVIMSLVKGHHHIPYRESKLTFLLRDSLGGNARTHIVANIHPNLQYASESLSTLQFASRSKMIKNKAKVNASAKGDIITLKNEVKRLTAIVEMYESTAVSNNTGSDNSTDGKQSTQQFFHAMRLWEMDSLKLNSKLEAMQNSVASLNNGFHSSRMVVKFRDETIRLLKNSSSVDVENKEIQLLKKEIKELNKQLTIHPDVTSLKLVNEELRQEIKLLHSQQSYKKFVDDMCNRRGELMEFYGKMKKSPLFLDETNQTLREENEDLKIKCDDLTEKCKSLETKLAELKMELTGTTKAKEDALKVLEEFKKGSKTKIEQLNSQHENTIKILSTPQKLNKKKMRLSSGNSDNLFTPLTAAKLSPLKENPDFSFNTLDGVGSNFLNESVDMGLNFDDDFSTSIMQCELDNLKESKSNLDGIVEKLENENVEFRQNVSTLEGKLLSVQENLKSEQVANLSIQENLENIAKDCQNKLEKSLQDCSIQLEEISDLKIILKSSDRELSEKKSQLKNTVELHNKDLEVAKSEVHALRKTLDPLKERIRDYEMELEKLNRENGDRDKDISNLKDVVTNYKTMLFEKNQQFEICMKEYKENLDIEKRSNLDIQNNLRISLSKYESKCCEQQAEILEHFAKIESLKALNTVYTDELTEKLKEIEIINSTHQLVIEDLHFKHLNEEQEKSLQIDKQLEDITRQADEIENYKDLASNLEIKISNLEMEKVKSQEIQQSLKSNVDENHQKLQTINLLMKEKMSTVEELKERIYDFETQLSEKEAVIETLNFEHNQFKFEKQTTEEMIKVLEESQSEYKEKISKCEKELTAQLEHKNELEDMLARKDEQYKDLLVKHNQQIEENKSTENYRFKIENLQDDLDSWTEQYSTLFDEMKDIMSKERESQKRFDDLTTLHAEQENLLNLEQEKVKSLSQQIGELKSQNEKLLSDSAQLAGHTNHNQKIRYLEKMKAQICRISEEKTAIQLKYDKLLSTYKLSENKN